MFFISIHERKLTVVVRIIIPSLLFYTTNWSGSLFFSMFVTQTDEGSILFLYPSCLKQIELVTPFAVLI